MSLTVQEKEEIAVLIESKLSELRTSSRKENSGYSSSIDDRFFHLSERMVRIEEELKHQREIFIDMRNESNRRFDEMRSNTDGKLSEIRNDSNRKYDEVNKQLDRMDQRIYRFMVWSFSTMIALTGIGVSIIKFL